MKIRHRLLILALMTLLSTGCDQATKQIASATLKSAPAYSYLGDLFRLQYSENPGAFLSLGADLPDDARAGIFMVGVGVLLVAVLIFALAARGLRPASVAALALFLGGGFSNWADRIVHGNVVVDFMNVGIGPLRTGIFNVADLCVVGGAALLFASEVLSGHGSPPPAQADTADRPREEPVQAQSHESVTAESDAPESVAASQQEEQD